MARRRINLEPEVHAARTALPGNVRQRIKRAIDGLRADPRPAESWALDLTGLDVPPNVEVRRLRIDRWRIVYAINDDASWVWVLAVRRRPPYDYEDVKSLISRLP